MIWPFGDTTPGMKKDRTMIPFTIPMKIPNTRSIPLTRILTIRKTMNKTMKRNRPPGKMPNWPNKNARPNATTTSNSRATTWPRRHVIYYEEVRVERRVPEAPNVGPVPITTLRVVILEVGRDASWEMDSMPELSSIYRLDHHHHHHHHRLKTRRTTKPPVCNSSPPLGSPLSIKL